MSSTSAKFGSHVREKMRKPNDTTYCKSHILLNTGVQTKCFNSCYQNNTDKFMPDRKQIDFNNQYQEEDLEAFQNLKKLE